MQRSTEKLYKIFKLEAEFNYSNRAVVGGLEKLANSWAGEARADGLAEDKVQQVLSRLEQYPNLDGTGRAHALNEIGQVLDIAGIKHLPEPETPAPEPNTVLEPEPVRPLPPKASKPSRGSMQKRSAGPAPAPNQATARGLSASVTAVRGIGEKQAGLLAKLGIFTIEDMLYYFPNRYDDYSELKLIQDLDYGEEVTILAWVKSVKTFKGHNNRKITQAIVSDDTGAIQLMWFNQEYQMRYLRKDMFLAVSGKVEQYMGRHVMYHPDYEQVDQEQLNTRRIVPVYGLTAQLSQRWLRRAMHSVISYWAPKIPDYITEYILEDADLLDLSTSLMEIHFPESKSSLRNARSRLAFDEIFMLQLGVLRQKNEWNQLKSRTFAAEDDWLAARASHLPFQLTGAQFRALDDIRKDLASGRPMNRLLQGDVGSGKTVVAALGLSIILHNGAQGAFMAPTSILAEQHFASLKRLLANPEDTEAPLQDEEIRLLIGDTPTKEREAILTGLAEGTVKLVIGTHALLEDPVQFKDLQMAIVDEQHRFGVAQRAALREKGENPHLLVMTATPIPRSLALTIYGDLDLSVMDEMPAGRQPISTHILYPTEKERTYNLIRGQVAEGHQAFVIYPLVEQGENDENMAAVQEQERLQKEIFPNLRVGLLHGRLTPDEKETVMRKFRDNEFQVLVSTSVVEVGVDIPNATVMVIEGANRFGLAQLHQFRGRVGRGSAQSYCILIPENNDSAENERLRAMESTNDGFVLAEHDLNQRGPGEFLGTRQSGYAGLRLANLTDIHLIEKARYYAEQVFENDPTLAAPEHQLMLDALNHFWPSKEGDLS